MTASRLLISGFVFVLGMVMLPYGAFAQKAFPSAEGFGANAKGGRGGSVIYVTNLNNSGTGSLRACVEASGPRTCVFRVGGTISLSDPLNLRNSFITIAGQTAPGDGIQVKGNGDSTLVLGDNVSDVIIRHIRLRPGDGSSADAVTILRAKNIIFDHVSTEWGNDENFGVAYSVENATVQWSILGEGLQPHSKGALWCNGGSSLEKCASTTFYANLFAHNNDRNPNIDMSDGERFDLIGNVIYNPKSDRVEIHDTNGGSRVNIIGNTFKKGPSSAGAPAVNARDYNSGRNYIYLSDNDSDTALTDSQASSEAVSSPAFEPTAPIESASVMYTKVLAGAGATLPKRDPVDIRIVNDVKNGTGRIIGSESEVGGYPTFQNGTPYLDADKDGMADSWETSNGLNPNNASDRNGDLDNDGYTNLEEYLNELAGDGTSSGDGSSGGGSSGGSNPGPTSGLCNVYESGGSVPNGYGVPWHVFSTARNLLLSSYCHGNGSVEYTVGNDSPIQYIYNQGYLYQNGGWWPYTLSGNFAQGSSVWLVGEGNYTNTKPPLSDYFWVAYICEWTGNQWKCGCRDQQCSTNYWQIQGVQR